MGKLTCEVVKYGGWDRCVKLSNGETELIATTEVGPRVIRFGFTHGPNLLKEFPGHLGRRGGKRWRMFGGHRLWTAPEEKPRTYLPDNDPIAWSWRRGTLLLRTAADTPFGIVKEIRITAPAGGAWRISHRIINRGRRTLEIAPWALTVMAPGGEAILPQEPYIPHPKGLRPARPVVLWPYTDMADPRWSWGRREIRLRQESRPNLSPQKIGLRNTAGWMAYQLDDTVFVKRHPFDAKAVYPDFNCNAETFTDTEMLELESLGPLRRMSPGARSDHDEYWILFRTEHRPSAEQISKRVARITF